MDTEQVLKEISDSVIDIWEKQQIGQRKNKSEQLDDFASDMKGYIDNAKATNPEAYAECELDTFRTRGAEMNVKPDYEKGQINISAITHTYCVEFLV